MRELHILVGPKMPFEILIRLHNSCICFAEHPATARSIFKLYLNAGVHTQCQPQVCGTSCARSCLFSVAAASAPLEVRQERAQKAAETRGQRQD